MSNEDLAWAAGFFDGEGSTVLYTYKSGRVYIHVSITQNERELLDRFQQIVGSGKVYGPYQPKGRKNPYYSFMASGHTATIKVMGQLRPWLGSAKIAQYESRIQKASLYIEEIARKKV